MSIGSQILAGGVAGTSYWLACYPMDVIKARIQAAPDVSPPVYNGVRGAAQAILKEQGWKGFFAGFTPCLVRALPANAACFVAFEFVMDILPE